MFNGGGGGGGGGVPHEQFHQFIASTTRTALPLTLPLTLPHNVSHSHNNQSSAPAFISTFDPHHHLAHHHHHQQQQQLFHESQLFHSNHNPHHNTSSTANHHHQDEHEEKQEESCRVVDCGSSLDLEQLERGVTRMRSVSDIMDPWEKEEVLALLRIRSNMGTNGFSDLIWGHVSRKLAELGFKRSAERCKEKFEEMNHYSNNTTSYAKNNYRSSFSELEALFEDQNPKSTTTTTTTTNTILSAHDQDIVMRSHDLDGSGEGKVAAAAAASLNLEENSGNETLENPYVDNQSMLKKQLHRKKRKRNHKFEMLKGLCEEIVSKIMGQQEELHRKLLEDMERKEEERVSREEAWKQKEMDRINKEIEMRSQEQAIACDREATIIGFLKKLTTTTTTTTSPLMENQDLGIMKIQDDMIINNTSKNPNPQPTSPSTFPTQNPTPLSRVSSTTHQVVTGPKLPTSPIAKRNPSSSSSTQHNIKQKLPNSSNLDMSSQNPSSSSTTTTPIGAAHNYQDKPSSINTSISEREQDHGKRWPREEVNSLINLRCNVHSGSNVGGGGEDNKAGESTKVPLWERISQGMLEMGYKRSAKKCKEKWENINKYFRKTKDANKKRSLDSKTCPYFHQLNSLYNQGTLSLLPSDQPTPVAAAAAHVDNNNQLPSSPDSPSKSPETRRSGGLAQVRASDEGLVVHVDDHHQGCDEKDNVNSQVTQLEFEY